MKIIKSNKMSKKANKIKKKELETIQNLQGEIAKAVNQVGVLEAQKHSVLHAIEGLNQEMQKVKQELEEEYGAIQINLEDGTYTEIEAEETE